MPPAGSAPEPRLARLLPAPHGCRMPPLLPHLADFNAMFIYAPACASARTFLTVLLIGSFLGAAPDATSQVVLPSSAQPTIERQILNVSTEWFDALMAQDYDALDRLQLDEFVTVQQTATGVALIGKANQLEALKKSGEPRRKLQRELSAVRVRLFGNVAILTAVATFVEVGENTARKPSQGVTTEVWVNEGGRWRLAHFQPTAVLIPGAQK